MLIQIANDLYVKVSNSCRLPFITLQSHMRESQPIMLNASASEGNVPSFGLLQSADNIALITAN